MINLVACISPFRQDREFARSLAKEDDFIEIFVDCPLATCEQRDVKGLYKKALAGEIPNFTGVSDPYEPPENPEIVVKTGEETLEESVAHILSELEKMGMIPKA